MSFENDDNDDCSDDDDCFNDEDYVTCAICGLIVLKSSDGRARGNGCCLDCYYDVIWDRENAE